jgi:hypothetical protein
MKLDHYTWKDATWKYEYFIPLELFPSGNGNWRSLRVSPNGKPTQYSIPGYFFSSGDCMKVSIESIPSRIYKKLLDDKRYADFLNK